MIEIIPNWHPVFVHFPIAFTTAAVFFFTVSQLFQGKPWAAHCLLTGRWMLWGAAIFASIAAMFGWYAYNSVQHDEASHRAMTIHAYWALAALGALALLAAVDFRSKHAVGNSAYGFLVLLVAAWLLILSTAWHGGEVVFRHGLGVMTLPNQEAHTHEHGEGHGDMHEHDDKQAGDAHGHSHDEIAHSADTTPKKHAHTHAPGTPPHKD